MVLIPTPPSSLTPPPPNYRRVDILYYKRLTKGTLSVINRQLSWIQNSQKISSTYSNRSHLHDYNQAHTCGDDEESHEPV